MRTVMFAAVVLCAWPTLRAQESAPLAPAEAAKKVGSQVTVEMAVRSTGGNRNRYLNSAASYTAADNFTIYIPEAAVKAFAEAKIERPEEYFYGKTIRVTGAVRQARWVLLGQPVERPQIVVTDPKQIAVVESLSGPPVFKRTHIYKRVGDLAIRADSYRFHDRPAQPVVVWIHGGALMMGHRESVPRWLLDAAREHGFVLVSLDYRLAPETRLAEIVADVEDAFRWIRASGPELFQADPQRVAVAGGSAGGYLTLATGHRVAPRPVALVSLWGYGDLVGPWYSQPHPTYKSPLTREEAAVLDEEDPVSDDRDRQHAKASAFYRYCRQHGRWPQEVAGWDPRTEVDKFKPYMPVNNVSAEYPPTLLIHGDRDTDVPYEQSQLMAAELKKHGVEHHLLTVAGAEHGLAGAPQDEVQAAYRTAVEFLRRHLAKE